MSVIYSIGIYLFQLIISILAFFNPKAKLWIEGRKNWRQKLQKAIPKESKVIWFHAASLGEFEQARLLIEKIKKEQKDIFLLLTFFSPSGYEIRKDYDKADYICYLPADTPQNAKDFVQIANPQQVFFIKYEFWYNYLSQIKKHNSPLYLVSGIFRSSQIFFKFYGIWFKKQLTNFDCFFLQDQSSLDLINSLGYTNAVKTGDTRFDRVIEIAEQVHEIPKVKDFVGTKKCLIIGSSWPQDEDLLVEYINTHVEYKYILAPHEIHEVHLKRIESSLKLNAERYSRINKTSKKKINVMIIDNIGMLSSIYQYATVCYVGGAFGTGLHNILEAAVYGKPVIFGPQFSKFQEANDLLEEKAVISVSNFESLFSALNLLFTDEIANKKMGKKAKDFIYKSKGAVESIYSRIFIKNYSN